MKNLLKTWNIKELNKTLVSYSKRVKEYQPQERNNFYYRMQKQITLINSEINSRN